MERIYWISVPISLLFQVLIITALIRGTFKRYPFLLLLLVSEFLSTIVNLAAIMDFHHYTPSTVVFYWIGEGVTLSALFLSQVHMLYQSISEENRAGRLLSLILGSILFMGLATWQAYDPAFNRWMTQLARNFSFGSMFVNLTLWTVLVRHMDRQRLLITAGLGIQLAGDAIGHSLRQMSRSLVTGGNVILVLTYLVRLYIIWRALCPGTVPVANSPHVEKDTAADIDGEQLRLTEPANSSQDAEQLPTPQLRA
ncbi:MAG: hypothetical protein IT166_00100 [Bryobacterales bacterium]|nr:hypothetical protein [Bryobacterales bacterium]